MTTNRTLALVLVAAIFVNLGCLWLLTHASITGLQSSVDYGTATLVIASVGSLRFVVNSTNWGTGRVNTTNGNQNCILDTRGANSLTKCINFSTVTQGLTIENNGDTNVTVQLYFSTNFTDFLGGDPTLGWFRYNVSNNETNSCRNSTGGTGCPANVNCTVAPIAWTDVNNTAYGTTVCPKLLFTDTSDSLLIDLNLSVPYDAPAGSKLSTLTATATSVS